MREHRIPFNTKLFKYTFKMATNTWQLLVFISCSLALMNFISVAFGKEITARKSSSLNNSLKKPTLNFGDVMSTSSTNLDYSKPGLYHSIIDRTNDASSSALKSSPMQASLTSTADDLNTAAGHHHGHHHHGKYYEYREVPKKKTWKFGYKRGNHKHTIQRHEHGKAGKHPHFKTKVKWHDKKSKGKGIHLWDYNHHDKKHYHHG